MSDYQSAATTPDAEEAVSRELGYQPDGFNRHTACWAIGVLDAPDRAR